MQAIMVQYKEKVVRTFMQNQSGIMNSSCNVLQATRSMIYRIESTDVCKQRLTEIYVVRNNSKVKVTVIKQ